jgi:hypothetical protein
LDVNFFPFLSHWQVVAATASFAHSLEMQHNKAISTVVDLSDSRMRFLPAVLEISGQLGFDLVLDLRPDYIG